MEKLAEWLERRIVIPEYVGSNPSLLPIHHQTLKESTMTWRPPKTKPVGAEKIVTADGTFYVNECWGGWVAFSTVEPVFLVRSTSKAGAIEKADVILKSYAELAEVVLAPD